MFYAKLLLLSSNICVFSIYVCLSGVLYFVAIINVCRIVCLFFYHFALSLSLTLCACIFLSMCALALFHSRCVRVCVIVISVNVVLSLSLCLSFCVYFLFFLFYQSCAIHAFILSCSCIHWCACCVFYLC